MAEEEAPAAKRLARAGSFSGVWWKLGDAAVDPSAADRRLRSIADEETDLRARIASRQAAARGVRRKIALGSLALEAVAFIHAYWTARRWRVAAGWSRKLLLLVLPPLLAVPASAAVVFAAFARFHKIFEARDQQRLQTLVAERKAKIGQFRGSHHNMQKLLEKYDPDAAAETDTGSDQPFTAAVSRIKRSHSRLSIYKKSDKDAAEAATTGSDQPAAAAASTRIKRSHSRLSFHIGDE
uniref:Uncharacterized protein n=1 Tax=Avena sativa TaxID=4498 RepID=A0ACD5YQR7_AVESA